jgi:phenylalanyl-tRNA synthetase alpha chain
MNQLPTLDQIDHSYQSCTTQDQLDRIYDSYLGKNGSITAIFKTMWSLSVEEKKEIGAQLGVLKAYIIEHFDKHSKQLKIEAINTQLQSELIDIHSIGSDVSWWHYHLLTQVRRNMEDIFGHLWFAIEYGDEVVTKYENFESVNIPLTHPATEMHDTYYLSNSDERGHNLVLRTHTSAMQQKIIQKYGSEFKCIIPGKVYRCESTDSTHDTMFWQLEWMVVGKGISIPDFTGLMQEVFGALFQTDIKVRLRPSYFPFTEPSFEMDASCTPDQPELYQLSKETWWVELWGAGMIHPNVLREAWVDPDIYTGFAFGMGLTRMAAIKHQIRDIRYFTNWDIRFIQSF